MPSPPYERGPAPAETRFVLVKPGEVLLIGGAKSLTPETWDHAREFFAELGIRVVAFADDIDIAAAGRALEVDGA